MSGAATVKYPHSANLFSFCKRVLDHKFNGLRVMDQDVGQILGFDPADCSHWKRGRKSIRSLDAIRTIARHLNIDERIVAEVASGEISDAEAMLEYQGPGDFDMDHRRAEIMRKEWFRSRRGEQDHETVFRSFFGLNDQYIDTAVRGIHEKIGFREAPLFLPEVFAAYPELKLVEVDILKEQLNPEDMIPCLFRNDGVWEIHCVRGVATRPVVRFQIARMIGLFFLNEILSDVPADWQELNEYRSSVHCNVFAGRLLTPAAMIRQEVSNIDLNRGMVGQLAESFWVSKSFMNARLRAVLQHNEA